MPTGTDLAIHDLPSRPAPPNLEWLDEFICEVLIVEVLARLGSGKESTSAGAALRAMPRSLRQILPAQVRARFSEPGDLSARPHHGQCLTLLFRRPLDLCEIACPIDDPNHLHSVFHQPVKRKPAFDKERPGAFGDLGARGAELRMIPKQPALLFDAVINLVGGGEMLARDLIPDIEQVCAGAVRVANLAHALTPSRRQVGRALPSLALRNPPPRHRRC